MAKEGKQVRVAMNGPDVEHDQLLGKIGEFNREDGVRASSAGETRQKIGHFLDTTSLNSKAFAWLRQIIKTSDKADGQNKAMDIIRSLEVGLPMVKAHVAGQGSGEMNLDGPADDAKEPTDDAAPASEQGTEVGPGKQETEEETSSEDPETAEFNDAVDEAMGEGPDDGDTVIPFDPDQETPINFGGEAAE